MRLGRTAKRALIVLGALALLFALVHTPPAKELVRRILSTVLSAEELDYQLWRGQVELRDVSMDSDAFTFTAARVLARVSLGLQVSAEIEEAELVLLDFFDTPATDYEPALPWIRTLRAHDAAIRLQDHDEQGAIEEWIALDGVAIDIVDMGEEHRVGLHSSGGHVRDEPLGAIDADLFLIPGSRIRIASLSLLKDDSFLRAEGELDFGNALQGSLDVSFALDGALARMLDEELDVRGVITGSSELQIADGEPSLQTEIGSEAIEWRNVRAEDVTGTARFADGVLVVERLDARGLGGSVRMGATIAFREGSRNRFDARWSGIDTSGALPVSARLSGEASLSLLAWDLETASGDARVELEAGSEITGSLSASLASGIVALKTTGAALPAYGAEADFEGTLTTTGDLALDYDARIRDVRPLLPDGMPFEATGAVGARGRIEGSIASPAFTADLSSDGLRLHDDDYLLSGSVHGTTTGLTLQDVRLNGERVSAVAQGSIPLDDSGAWQVEAGLDGLVSGALTVSGEARDPDWSARLRLEPERMDVTVRARKRGRELLVEELTGSIASGSLSGTGRLDLDTELIEASLTLRDLDPGRLPEAASYLGGLDGIVSADARVSGPWRSPSGEAEIGIDPLRLGEVALPSVTLSIVSDGASVGFRAVRAGGREFVNGTLLLSEDYPLHFDASLDAFPLTEVLHAFPVFVERERGTWSLEGTASLDVPLSDPSQLRFQARVARMTGMFQESVARTRPFTVTGNPDHVRLQASSCTESITVSPSPEPSRSATRRISISPFTATWSSSFSRCFTPSSRFRDRAASSSRSAGRSKIHGSTGPYSCETALGASPESPGALSRSRRTRTKIACVSCRSRRRSLAGSSGSVASFRSARRAAWDEWTSSSRTWTSARSPIRA